VWSLGVTLFLLVGAEQTFRLHNPALSKRQKSPGMAVFEHFMRGFIDGHRGGMYATAPPNGSSIAVRDGGVSGACGLHNPAGGVPTNSRLWKLFPKLDPDAKPVAGRFSPELKDLLNRIFDPDETLRIEIEDILHHPWLQSHQAMGLHCQAGAAETAPQRSAYFAEMANRFLDPTFHAFDAFKLKNSTPVELLPPLSKSEAHKAVHLYIDANTEQAELESGTSALLRRFKSFFIEDLTPPPPIPPTDEARTHSNGSGRTSSSEPPPSPNAGTPLALALKCNPFDSIEAAQSVPSPEDPAGPPSVDEDALPTTIDIFRGSQQKDTAVAQVVEKLVGAPVIFRVQVTQVQLQLQWVRTEESSATFGEWRNFCSSMTEVVNEIIADRVL
jgi:serine/threonine protein kinase